jgi:hypothetical protein
MRQKIKNTLHIDVEGADLTGATKPELYLRQGISGFFRSYTPEILSATEVLAEIPFDDAMQLRGGRVALQLAWTDANGNPMASDAAEVDVGILLKEAGYDPA